MINSISTQFELEYNRIGIISKLGDRACTEMSRARSWRPRFRAAAGPYATQAALLASQLQGMTTGSDRFPSTATNAKAHRPIAELEGPVVLVPEIIGVEEDVLAVPLQFTA